MKLIIMFFSIVLLNTVFTGLAYAPSIKSEIKIETQYDISLQTGDLILRRGKGLISDFFRRASLQDSEYSHAGMIIKKGNACYVYHMIGQGDQEPGFKAELFNDFVNSKDNSGFAVYRYSFMSEYVDEITLHLNKLKEKNPPFDHKFIIETDEALYCTEMIYKTLLDVCSLQLPTTEINNMKYISVDNLYYNQPVAKISSINY